MRAASGGSTPSPASSRRSRAGSSAPSTATEARRRPQPSAFRPASRSTGAGNLFIADGNNGRVRRIDAVTGIITTVAGGGPDGGDGGPATAALFGLVSGVALDGAGDVFIIDRSTIRRVDAVTGIITTVAQLSTPSGVALDGAGNLFIADTGSARVRRVDGVTGIITTVAGKDAFASDGGPATTAQLATPQGVALDCSSNLFIADIWNARVRRVDAVTGIITTVAGGGYGGREPCDGRNPRPSIRHCARSRGQSVHRRQPVLQLPALMPMA